MVGCMHAVVAILRSIFTTAAPLTPHLCYLLPQSSQPSIITDAVPWEIAKLFSPAIVMLLGGGAGIASYMYIRSCMVIECLKWVL